MPDQAKNIAIGIFVIAACAIVVFITLFLHPKTGDEAKLYHIRFADIDKVNVGTRVTFAGKPVGEVKEIEELPNSRQGYVDDEGNVYPYELTIVVDSGISIYNTDLVMLRTSGLLGERSVAIVPEPIKKGTKSVLIGPTDLFYANNPGSIEDTLKDIKKLSRKFGDTLDETVTALRQLREDHVWENVGDAVLHVKNIAKTIDQPKKLNEIIDNIESFSEHANQFSERLLHSWKSVDDILKNIDTTTATTTTIVEKINNGEGTLGRIVSGDDLYLRFVSILNKIETIGDDVNHYGLLFQTDKGWQRLRARRMNMLAKLSSPQEFRNYFNDEIDQISTSLSRVSMVLERTGDSYDPCLLIEDREFSKVFAELLRRISGLEEELRMFNGQVVDCDVKKTELEPSK